MKTITETLLPQAAEMDKSFREGAQSQRERGHDADLAWCRMVFQDEREAEGFVRRLSPLVTPPAWNMKLEKGVTPSYGLTLQHTTTHIRKRLSVNACPHAGDCMKVCVLDNGNGGFDSVQRARRAKTRFLINQPRAFSFLLGYELAMALDRHLNILFRPNVNSDIRWDLLLPSLFDKSALGGHCTSYNYTKDPWILETDGWVTPNYRVAYSWDENSPPIEVARFLERGGSVAMVTSRRKGQPIEGDIVAAGGGFLTEISVPAWLRTDADVTDEWIFQPGMVGDLSAKGRARNLIGTGSGFVVEPRPAATGKDVVHAA